VARSGEKMAGSQINSAEIKICGLSFLFYPASDKTHMMTAALSSRQMTEAEWTGRRESRDDE
jgi:hypothetical protein